MMRLKKIKTFSNFFKKHRRKIPSNCSPCKYPKTISFQRENSKKSNKSLENPLKIDCTSPVCDCEEELLIIACQALELKRLSFEPDEGCCIMGTSRFDFEECLVFALESDDPYMDFTSSMEQMIRGYGFKANGVMDWCSLEELLSWYLMMNNRKCYDFIVAAFVDLCMNMSAYTC